ncbi:MAG: hypothetical protein ABW022_11455 [Actinoplanes sp.]
MSVGTTSTSDFGFTLFALGAIFVAAPFAAFGWVTLLVLNLMAVSFVAGFIARPRLAPRLSRFISKENAS